ncbi:tyrosine-type recombinase/integrase, partial [Dongia sp.]|uniref:tyrosine-type recombinase/integrase n=1 Tax=Dongia sp. TaxID=1977262 RepID=UPI0035B12286
MSKEKFTAVKIKSLVNDPPATGRAEYFEIGFPAFGIRVSASGVASWFVFYRIDGKQVRDAIGRYPVLSLADAREEAARRLRLVDKGIDPRQEKARQKAQEAKRRAETFGEVAKSYKAGHLDKIKSGGILWERVEIDLLPAWRDLPIRDLTRGAVATLLDKVEVTRGIYARNRRLALIRHMLNFALDRELVDANVAARLKMLPEPDRQRILTDGELVEVWRAADQLADAFGRFTKLLILTGQRRREVSDMPRAEVDLDADLWIIAADRMKAGVAHAVPLAPQVKALIEDAPVIEG